VRNVVLDNTILSTLMSCPRLSDFRFNMNLVGLKGKSPSLEMGSIVHTIIEYYYKASMQGATRANSIDLGMRAGRAMANNNEETKNATSEDIELVFTTMEQYFDYYKNDFWIPLEVEKVIAKVLYEDDEIRILWKAKLDALVDTNQGIFPTDHKTMKQRRDTLSLNNQFMGQCLVTGTTQVIINKIGFQTTLKPNEKFTRPVISYNTDRLVEWQGTILPYYAKLLLMYEEAGYYPPNYTHCENKYGFCPFKDVCEAPPNLRENELKNNFMVGKPWDPSNEKEEAV
jgi:hypothetical protein